MWKCSLVWTMSQVSHAVPQKHNLFCRLVYDSNSFLCKVFIYDGHISSLDELYPVLLNSHMAAGILLHLYSQRQKKSCVVYFQCYICRVVPYPKTVKVLETIKKLGFLYKFIIYS